MKTCTARGRVIFDRLLKETGGTSLFVNVRVKKVTTHEMSTPTAVSISVLSPSHTISRAATRNEMMLPRTILRATLVLVRALGGIRRLTSHPTIPPTMNVNRGDRGNEGVMVEAPISYRQGIYRNEQ